MENEKYVVVTTDKRGVFAGVLTEDNGDTVVLSEARNAVYWDRSVKGFLGLAANGPGSGCRIGPAAPSVKVNGITSVTTATDKARKAWEAEPWSG